jgi:hypothetical protein
MVKTVFIGAFEVPSAPFPFPDMDSAASADSAQNRRLPGTVVPREEGQWAGESERPGIPQKAQIERV